MIVKELIFTFTSEINSLEGNIHELMRGQISYIEDLQNCTYTLISYIDGLSMKLKEYHSYIEDLQNDTYTSISYIDSLTMKLKEKQPCRWWDHHSANFFIRMIISGILDTIYYIHHPFSLINTNLFIFKGSPWSL